MSEIKVLAIDLAKRVFQLHGVEERGQVVLRKQVRRQKLLECMVQMPACTVAMEACGGAHYWAREISKLGHQVHLIPTQYVKPYVKGNKTDRNDAEAISEAAQRPNLRSVPVKSEEQQAMMAAQRLRSLLVKTRTAWVNHLRGELGEFGICIPKGVAQVRKQLHEEMALPSAMAEGVAQMRDQLQQLEEAIREATQRIQQRVEQHPVCTYLMKRCGIGVLTAHAVVAQIEPTHFKNGRHLSAFIGLVPREHSSGGKRVLMGISKRGNPELRTLLIHGARAVVRTAAGKEDPLSRWIAQLLPRRGKHKTIVAVANKLARYLWVDLMQARTLGLSAL